MFDKTTLITSATYVASLMGGITSFAALIVFAGSILGALSSIPILNCTAANVLKYVGNFANVDVNFKIILLTIILFLIVTLNLYYMILRSMTMIMKLGRFVMILRLFMDMFQELRMALLGIEKELKIIAQ